jgi:ELWxxDGT repeat protein
MRCGCSWLAVVVTLIVASGAASAAEDEAVVAPSATFAPGSPVRIKPVADLWPGEEGSYPRGMLEFRNELYFQASHPERGQSLWRFDGKRVEIASDLSPGGALWSWDGKQAKLEADINPGSPPSFCANLVVHAGRLYFSASHRFRPEEVYPRNSGLWSFDGRAATLVAEEADGVRWSVAGPYGSWREFLIFQTVDSNDKRQAWVFDGKVVTRVQEPAANEGLPSEAALRAVFQGRAFGEGMVSGQGVELCEFEVQPADARPSPAPAD